jgi:hypothetical protein
MALIKPLRQAVVARDGSYRLYQILSQNWAIENGLGQNDRTAKNLAALWPNISDVPLPAMYHF